MPHANARHPRPSSFRWPEAFARPERLIERAAAVDDLWLATGEDLAGWVETVDLPPVLHEPPVPRD